MAYDFVLIHLKFTIPAAAVLTAAAYPLLSRVHVYQIASLVLLAFFTTLPWDSYLVRHNVWTYPSEALIGPRLLGIPIEELFFVTIQTYITSLLYILANKPLLHAQYLCRRSPRLLRWAHALVEILLAAGTVAGACLTWSGGRGTYLGLVLAWACPCAGLAWSLGGRFMLRLPPTSTLLPILTPTLFLWTVDETAIGRGAWSITPGTKLGICLWGNLEIEEAVYFLLTNILIVFGLGVFDNAVAIIDAFPDRFPPCDGCPAPTMLIRALLLSAADYDVERILGIQEAVRRLSRKSRSFYIASAAFSGRLRIDLTLLYSFCRMADDLVDNAATESEIQGWITKLQAFLDRSFGSPAMPPAGSDEIKSFVEQNFCAADASSLSLLPTDPIPKEPLDQLLDGFRMDSQFASEKDARFPITDETALERYASCVASTVGELCVSLVFHHGSKDEEDRCDQAEFLAAARTMGVALQYVNIARDIWVDAQVGRVYLPATWLKEEGLTPEMVVLQRSAAGGAISRLRIRLLRRAFELYSDSRPVMKRLPSYARQPMIVAIESYMEIGRMLLEGGSGYTLKNGRAKVPTGRRLRVALTELLRTE